MKTNEASKVAKKESKSMTVDEKRQQAKESMSAIKTALAKYGKKSAA